MVPAVSEAGPPMASGTDGAAEQEKAQYKNRQSKTACVLAGVLEL